MQLLPFATAAAFGEAAGRWLEADERDNNLILSVYHGAVRRGDASRSWLVSGDTGPQLALWQSPPHYLLLSQGSAEAAGWAAERIEAELPGVMGPAAVADAFAERWARGHSQTAHLNSAMTFYALDRLAPFRRPGGGMRRAAPEEFERLAPLAAAAAREMNLPLPEQKPVEGEKGLRRALADGKQFVWAEGDSIRAMAAYAEALPHGGARIRGVYTPAEFRGRGYGSAIVGTLTEMLLEGGQGWVSLFADNANPTSTGIYRRLGFEPRLIFKSWRFDAE